jgi:hypothetical protein
MVVAFEIMLAAGVAVVAASFVAVSLGRMPDRLFVPLIAALTGAAGVAAVVLAVALATGHWDWEPLAVAYGGLAASAAAEAGAFGLSRGLRRVRSLEEESDRMIEQLDEVVAAHAQKRAAELERTLARERAETGHLLGEQERRLREERRAELARQVEEAGATLTGTVAESQQRLEGRLRAWSADLERAQQQLKVRLEELIRQQADALQRHEARLATHAAEVTSLEDEQHAAIARIREEIEKAGQDAFEAMQAEIEIHAAERRRALHEVGERLRTRERSMREQIEREELEMKAQLTAALAEVERRQLEQLERSIDRALVRLGEEAERRFDAQIRESRERTAERLGRELELQMETFTRSAEKEVANRIAEAAQVSATRFQRQIDDVVRAAEVQTAVSNERIHTLAERLEKSLEAADERLAAFEAHLEDELSAKLLEFERALRAAEQTVERERA